MNSCIHNTNPLSHCVFCVMNRIRDLLFIPLKFSILELVEILWEQKFSNQIASSTVFPIKDIVYYEMKNIADLLFMKWQILQIFFCHCISHQRHCVFYEMKNIADLLLYEMKNIADLLMSILTNFTRIKEHNNLASSLCWSSSMHAYLTISSNNEFVSTPHLSSNIDTIRFAKLSRLCDVLSQIYQCVCVFLVLPLCQSNNNFMTL